MFKQKQIGDQDPFGNQDQSFQAPKPLSIQVPDVHESMRLAGALDLKLDPKEKRQRLLCCCGERGCGIGPMTQAEDER